jgi:SAM-dependent methyltransferase
MTTLQDARNKTTWSQSSSRRWLDAYEAFTDLGERAALDAIRDRVRGRAILDIGVGTGRTIPLLAPLAGEYLGVDYLQAMVDACRHRHPHVQVELGDARRLHGVPSGAFALVNFSFNGIDAVAHHERLAVLSEMRRVLADDGVAVFSTLNLAGPARRERPWAPTIAASRNPLKRAVRTGRAWAGVPLDLVRWAKLRNFAEDGEGWAVSPLSAHHYGVVAHFTTLRRQLAELDEAGLDCDVVYDNIQGARVTPNDDSSKIAWFHIVARRR